MRFFTELRVKPENCYGLDISEIAINLCKSLSPNTMNFQVCSVLNMPFENNMFDIILCSGLFDCFNDDNDIRKISKEFKRVIKDDGVVLVIDINENFNQVYGKNEVVMQKNLRSFDSKKGELDHLLSEEFNLLYQKMYIFGPAIYTVNDSPAQLPHLPLFDFKMDREEFACPYNLWAFLKNNTK